MGDRIRHPELATPLFSNPSAQRWSAPSSAATKLTQRRARRH